MVVRFGMLPEELQGDREVVRETVKQNPHALRYASAQLQLDREVLMVAVT